VLKSPVLNVPPAKTCYKSDSEEDDGLDLVSDMVIVPSVGPVSESRRVSVSAESVDATILRKQRLQLQVVEKSADVTERLLSVVGMSPLLRTLDAEQRDMIVQAFTGPILKNAGDNIIQQGDSGDVFYLLEDGLVDVSIRRKGEESKQVHTYHSGDSFGELAIMYNAPRAATCTAQNACKLWALDRNSFKVIVVAAAMQKRETYSAFLTQVPILQSLTEMEVMTLADALREEEYKDGTTVCIQGEDGDYFYIIKDGIALCSQSGSDGEDKVVATLSAGNYFGGETYDATSTIRNHC
jgi:cAMP-dependent protein kinase regulator